MIISSKKYACETCIKGHRSSACKHTDRPLFEIKKKGRPVTQCEHCRELRKTKQVHVKCICESKDDSHHAPKLGFESAAFPNGLPQALEASVAFQPFAEGTSSDSDHGGVRHGHKCKSGDPCNCVSPRARTRARDASLDHHLQQQQQQHPYNAASASSSHNPLRAPAVLTRIAELRTILPRPTQDFGGPVHDPSTGYPHGHGSRYHNTKPYNHAAAHGMIHQHVSQSSSYPTPGPSNPTYTFHEQAYNRQPPMMGSSLDWAPQVENAGFGEFPSLCGCGDDCNCPGCLHHNRSTVPSSSAYMSCRNPETCATCLDCTIMSLPPSAVLPADTALSIYNNSQQIQNETIDDWLRQMSSASSFSPPDMSSSSTFNQAFTMQDPNPYQQQGFFQDQQQSNMGNIHSATYNNTNYGSSCISPMIPYGSPPNTGPVFPNQSSARTHRSHRSSIDDSVIDPRLLPPDGVGSHFLHVPDSHRSRSPSTSSQSSQQGSADGHGGGGPIPPYRPSGRMQGYPNPSASGGRQAPPLNIRPNAHRDAAAGGSGSSSSISRSPGSSGSSSTRSPFPPSSLGSPDYDPSLAGLHLY